MGENSKKRIERSDNMDNLVYIHHEIAVCDSLQVAEKFEKRHDNVLQSIDYLITENSGVKVMFQKSTYKANNGQKYRKYYMNRDGFTLLAMGFTGQKALEWKLQYINAFNRMESIIREKQTPAWQESRQTGMTTRKIETATIKRLCKYATMQGSKHPERLYTAYTKLANKAAGITTRTAVTSLQLSILTVAESIIAQTINSGIEENKPYKEIYQDCKKKLAVLQGVRAWQTRIKS